MSEERRLTGATGDSGPGKTRRNKASRHSCTAEASRSYPYAVHEVTLQHHHCLHAAAPSIPGQDHAAASRHDRQSAQPKATTRQLSSPAEASTSAEEHTHLAAAAGASVPLPVNTSCTVLVC
ncbi:hypothetical protein O3P69_000602 [Scylla paramamosain]|uniref:Uncharacterized protein n=1 Tax=Scylla paramamosain TaxID=85552 RepID=A0AAW0UUS6_SCYPA